MAQQQIPEEAYQLGEKHHLGTPTGVYRTQYTRADILFFWSQITIALLAVLIAFGFILALEVFHAHVAKLFLPVLIVFFTLNIANVSRTARRKVRSSYDPFTFNARVYLYEDGLLYIRSSKLEVLHWDEIKRMRCYTYQDTKNVRGFQPFVSVTRNDGKSLRFGANIADVASLGNIIEQAYTKRKHA